MRQMSLLSLWDLAFCCWLAAFATSALVFAVFVLFALFDLSRDFGFTDIFISSSLREVADIEFDSFVKGRLGTIFRNCV